MGYIPVSRDFNGPSSGGTSQAGVSEQLKAGHKPTTIQQDITI